MKLKKVTRRSCSQKGLWYEDGCGAAHALELIGERWAPLVMRELMFGPRRFSELRAGLPGISANVLTQRLAGLSAAGIVARRRLPPPASAQVYELTPWGYEAEPIFQVLGRWAARSPAHDPSLPISAATLMLSFRTMLDRERARGIDAKIGFRCGEDVFVAHLSAAGIAIARGAAEGAALILSGEPAAIAAVVYGGRPLETIEWSGDGALAARFVTLFPLPEKVP